MSVLALTDYFCLIIQFTFCPRILTPDVSKMFTVQGVQLQGWALRSVRYILFRSKKRTFRTFPFFSRVFGDLWDPKERPIHFRSFLKNGKERKERSVLLQRTEKNAKNGTFFCKERKITFCSFAKERENVPFFIQYNYRNIYRYI